MSTFLYIKANPKRDDSASGTMQVANAFIETYQAAYPDDTVEVVDLYDIDLDPRQVKDLANFQLSADSIEHRLANQFKNADKYVLAAPMWNYSTPSMVKAYIDAVIIAGITFNFTEKGPVGLLKDQGKKCLFISASGGDYSGEMSHLDFTEKYQKEAFRFMGIDDYQSIRIWGMATGKAEENIPKAITEAQELAKNW